jgi:hypothetical protein
MGISDPLRRRKIRLKEGNAKCRSVKINLYRDYAAGVYLSEDRNPIPPAPLSYCIRVYSILIHTQKGKGGELYQIEREKVNSSQSGVENTNMTDCISSL